MRDDTSQFEPPGIPDPDVLQRFLGGECSADEARAVRAWAGVMSDGNHLADVVRDAIRDDRPVHVAPGVERLWDGLRIRLGLASEPSILATSRATGAHRASRRMHYAFPRLTTRTTPIARRAVAWIASTVAIVVVIGGVLLSSRTARQSKTAERTYATSTGEQAVVTLDDGTTVTLAPRSTLRLSDFGSRARTVSLSGEAYFQVAHVSGVPFVVRTGLVTTRVLGTTFDVRLYPHDVTTRIAVTAGKVAVLTVKNAQTVELVTAGRVATATDSTVTAVMMEDAEPYTAWTTGRLVFRGTPTADVLAALTRWYGYEFKSMDSTLTDQKVTAGLSTQSLMNALATLKLVLDVDLSIQGKVITLRPRRHAERTPSLPSTRRDPFSTQTVEVGR